MANSKNSRIELNPIELRQIAEDQNSSYKENLNILNNQSNELNIPYYVTNTNFLKQIVPSDKSDSSSLFIRSQLVFGKYLTLVDKDKSLLEQIATKVEEFDQEVGDQISKK